MVGRRKKLLPCLQGGKPKPAKYLPPERGSGRSRDGTAKYIESGAGGDEDSREERQEGNTPAGHTE
uniref:Uncharacterized protein n=1 Tax=Hyaloperonospora arabidopsidis (strain Emoy2) TaxID=559515 RepID=M4B4I7_HYAAE